MDWWARGVAFVRVSGSRAVPGVFPVNFLIVVPLVWGREAGGVVGDFSCAGDMVAVVFEVLGQRGEFRKVGPDPLVIAVDAEAGGELAGEDGGAAGTTHRGRNMGIGEETTLFGEGIDVGRVDLARVVVVHTPDPGAHVIDGEEEDVRFLLCHDREGRWQCEGQAGEQC